MVTAENYAGDLYYYSPEASKLTYKHAFACGYKIKNVVTTYKLLVYFPITFPNVNNQSQSTAKF